MKVHNLPFVLEDLICVLAWGVHTTVGIVQECDHFIKYRGKIPATLLNPKLPMRPEFPIRGFGRRSYGARRMFAMCLTPNPYLKGTPFVARGALLQKFPMWSEVTVYLVSRLTNEALRFHHKYRGPLKKKLRYLLRCTLSGAFPQVEIWNSMFHNVFNHEMFSKAVFFKTDTYMDRKIISQWVTELEEAALVFDS